jgi:hypothetical protein
VLAENADGEKHIQKMFQLVRGAERVTEWKYDGKRRAGTFWTRVVRWVREEL